jgi:diguanylate cyclase (GGDEF)-like protein
MYPLNRQSLVIGRGADATIRLHEEGISRNHARVVLITEGVVAIEDLNSANGTFLNGERVERATFRDGDKLQIGSTTILRFTFHDDLDTELQAKMYDAALRDGLTGAINKRHFLERLEVDFSYSLRRKSPLTLLVFDIDHFKKINDTHGHLAGDYVLKTLSQIVQSTLRREDLFARFGGEEFVVLCRGITAGEGQMVAERIRSLVERHAFSFADRAIPVTVSVGVAEFPMIAAATSDKLLGAADSALYDAKRGGRNRVVVQKG